MYPFIPLQLTLLLWQRDQQADQELSDSSVEEEGDVEQDAGTSAPAPRYCTQEAYERYAKFTNLLPTIL